MTLHCPLGRFPGPVHPAGKQCRERYLHHLAPGINTDAWTWQEEVRQVSIQTISTLGSLALRSLALRSLPLAYASLTAMRL